MNINDIFLDIIHTASAAITADGEETKRQAFADIADDARRALESAANPAAPQGMAKLLTVAPGVTLVRFAGKDEIKLVARRVGHSGNPNTIFEIDVDKAERLASVWRDERLLFEIKGVSVNYSMIERCAVSALHRWFKNQRKHTSKRRHAIKARKLAAGDKDFGSGEPDSHNCQSVLLK